MEMEFTGERFVPALDGDIKLEHMHRYLVACELVAGKDVLDIACGEGYGTAKLAQFARFAYGVDISSEAVRHANSRYQLDNIKFSTGSCDAIPLPDHCVDLVVSFETIEHHDRHEEMMLEIKRVLRPGGVLLISSPDKQTYSVDTNYSNPYHIKELFADEFMNLLTKHFSTTKFFGQKITHGSTIMAHEGSNPQKCYRDDQDDVLGSNGMHKPLYLLGLASDGALPVAYTGIYEHPHSSPVLQNQFRDLLAERDSRIEDLEQALHSATSQIQCLFSAGSGHPGQEKRRPGLFRRLERSIRKRRKKWLGQINHSSSLKQFISDAPQALEDSKETILIVSHEASRTGAPILALNIAQHLNQKYNVVALLLRGGSLRSDFQQHCALVIEPFPVSDACYSGCSVLEKLLANTSLKFAIVNSIESRSVLLTLNHHHVPTLCLVHEFASYTYPKNAICEVERLASKVVFSAEAVFKNNAAQCAALRSGHRSVILPQGKCLIPDNPQQSSTESSDLHIRHLLRPSSLPANAVVILGAGTVHIRKGVDVFLMCAARVLELQPHTPFRFVWVGAGFNLEKDYSYSVYLQDQIDRSGLAGHVVFTGEVTNIELVYELSDVMLLSSRLDPLPNVAIDAMFRRLPVICFDKTTGVADIFKQHGLGEACVMPYLNVEKAAQRIATLIDDPDMRHELGRNTQAIGEKLFRMSSYVAALEQLALDSSPAKVIEESGVMNLEFYSPRDQPVMSRQQAAQCFVRSWLSGEHIRKPFPGFHPGIYHNDRGVPTLGINPLAAFLQAGQPTGSWLAELIVPELDAIPSQGATLRIALHIHVYFPELFPEIFHRISRQNLHIDLLISVPSMEAASAVRKLTDNYASGTVEIRLVPNRGRDIGPMVTEFSETILRNYDIIGHFHTKKSRDVTDINCGRAWFNFLLENLIGGQHPMATLILSKMSNDNQLGLVFPDDPHVLGWSENKSIADQLAISLGIKQLPDQYFNFPVGTMFWARTEAIRPLLELDVSWEDYPDEPLDYDGTMLHALERLVPLVVESQHYKSSLTYVPGVTR